MLTSSLVYRPSDQQAGQEHIIDVHPEETNLANSDDTRALTDDEEDGKVKRMRLIALLVLISIVMSRSH